MSWVMKITGTASADGNPGGTTVIDSTKTEPDDHFINMYMKITSGPYSGQIRQITDWVKSSGTFTVYSSFGGQITTGTTYEVSVTLPYNPRKVQDENPTERTGAKMPSDLPYLIVFGDKERKLIIEGYVTDPTKTFDQIWAEWAVPLKKLKHRVVVLVTPGGRYDGTYVVDDVMTVEEKYTNAFSYKIVYAQGSAYVVL